MLEPIIKDAEKFIGQFKTALLFIVCIALAFWVARCTAKKDAVTQERIQVLTHEIKVVDTLYRVDTLRAVRTKTLYDSARVTDTVMRHDSVFVYRPAADTAILACTAARHDCEQIRALNDSLTKQLVKQTPSKFWSRLGCNVGPSAVAAADGVVKIGVGATCGFRVFP